MWDFFMELQRSLKKKGHWYFILIFLLGISTFLFSLATVVIRQQNEVKRKYEETYTEWQYYSLFDSFVGKTEQEIYQDPLSVMKLKKLNELLRAEESFTYLEVYDNAVYIRDYSGPLENLNGYETNSYERSQNAEIHGKGTGYYSSVKGLWYGENVAEHFGWRLSEGAFPKGRDFVWNEADTVKVVLGAGYRDTYRMGEKFRLDFFLADKDAEVVGFLEEGETLFYKNRLVNLDYYLLLPQYDMESLSAETGGKEYHSFWFTYLMKNNGMVASHGSAEGVQDAVVSLCEKAGLPALYYIDQADNRQTTALGSNMGELIRTLSVLAAGSMALSVLLLCIHFSIRIKDNTHYYAILCCCGRSMKKIVGMAVGELLGLLLLSAAGGYLLAVFLAALLMLEAPEIYLPFLFLLGYGILPLLTALSRLRHLEIARGLREE